MESGEPQPGSNLFNTSKEAAFRFVTLHVLPLFSSSKHRPLRVFSALGRKIKFLAFGKDTL
jgi:hypothetical protein